MTNDENDEEELFFSSDKVISIINLLTKHKIRLWELPDLAEKSSATEDIIMKLSDESGLIENDLEHILQKLQSRSISKLEENKRYND
jgi:hypothetical protein